MNKSVGAIWVLKSPRDISRNSQESFAKKASRMHGLKSERQTLPFAFPVNMYSPFLSNAAMMFCSHCEYNRDDG